jgi:flagellin
MISLVTNVDSLEAQQNLNIDNEFLSKTIQQLTSGYRINSSGDDAAGLAIANGYRSSVAELNQGVMNANNGISQLQIIDGGLSNISTILDRLKTLATESASSTFTGSRSTLNQEYSQLLTEITRQASNINLNAGGTFNNLLSVYIGGATMTSNATISVDLSGSQSAVDATSLGLSTTNVLGGGVGIGGNTLRIDAPGAAFVVGVGGTDDQTFTFNVFANGSAQTITATVPASAGGSSLSSVLSTLNSQLNQYGIDASTDANGALQFSGSNAFTVADNGGTGTQLLTNDVAGTAENTANYIVDGKPLYVAGVQTLKFQTSAGSTSVALVAADSLTGALAKINAATASLGVYAVENAAGTGISFQGANSFSVDTSAAGVFTAAGYNTSVAPINSDTNNASSAISAIDSAIQTLGLVQGRVGAGENLLQYATTLAQSQISSFSAAESQLRDANVAAQAANLTKAQVLTQTSVAALAQANSEPQAVLKLLQG